MTTTTHTVAAMLAVAVAALDSANRAAKKETGAPLFALGTDMGNGVKFRELKAWAKEFAAKQKEAAPVKTEIKPKGLVLDGPKPTASTKVFPVRTIDVSGSTNLQTCEFDRNTKTLTVSFKNGDVWAYADVSLKDVRLLEEAESKGSHFSKVLKPAKVGTKVNGGAVAKAPKAESKPAAQKAESVAVSTSELREKGFYAGRKHEQVAKIVRNKETNEREVIAVSGTRYALETIVDVKGKFRVSELVESLNVIKDAPAPKTKPAAKQEEFETEGAAQDEEFTAAELRGEIMQVGRKTDMIEKVVRNKTTGNREIITESGARYEVLALRKNNRGKFVLKDEASTKAPAKTEAKPAAKKAEKAPVKHESRAATKDDLVGNEVRVIKGSKERMVKIIRVVNRDNVRTAVTETKAGLPFAQIMIMDGVPTYVGKTLPIADFRAL